MVMGLLKSASWLSERAISSVPEAATVTSPSGDGRYSFRWPCTAHANIPTSACAAMHHKARCLPTVDFALDLGAEVVLIHLEQNLTAITRPRVGQRHGNEETTMTAPTPGATIREPWPAATNTKLLY